MWVAGCNDSALGPTHRRPNRVPDTVLTGGPPAFAHDTDYHVHLFWIGNDADGRIDHFDYILVDHPAIGDSLHAVDSLTAGRFAGLVPLPDDPRWMATSAHDSIFTMRADSLPRPAQPLPGENEDFVRRQSFERWHTFFIRAVDNEGATDPTPDYRSFNTTTIAPYVWLEAPVRLGRAFQAPPTTIFHWDGADPMNEVLDTEPIASRWALIRSRRDETNHYIGYPESLYALAPSRWSPWARWHAPDESGRRAVVRGLDPVDPDRPNSGFYLFAVQAMDEAGAVTPVFDDHTPNRNNAVPVFVSGLVGPTLVVDETFL